MYEWELWSKSDIEVAVLECSMNMKWLSCMSHSVTRKHIGKTLTFTKILFVSLFQFTRQKNFTIATRIKYKWITLSWFIFYSVYNSMLSERLCKWPTCPQAWTKAVSTVGHIYFIDSSNCSHFFQATVIFVQLHKNWSHFHKKLAITCTFTTSMFIMMTFKSLFYKQQETEAEPVPAFPESKRRAMCSHRHLTTDDTVYLK